MPVAACPDCDAQVQLDADVRATEIVECGECRIELEVATVDPATLVPAPEVEEDWGE